MRLLPLLALCVSFSGCLQIGMPSDSGSGAASGGSGGTSADAGTAASGLHCGTDPGSGISLCLGISSCPQVAVDPDQFPSCGFRISGTIIDLECLCGDALCPMGSAASCADAKSLLSEQSALGVCARVAEGRCETVKQSAGGTPTSTCDKECRAQCAGNPGCITLCGC